MSVGIEQIVTVDLIFSFTSGIFPNVGNTLVGITSGARLTVTNVIGDTIRGFVTEGTFVSDEQCQVGATGFSGTLQTIDSGIYSNGLFAFNEQITNLDGDLAVVEAINLETGQETPISKLRYGIGASTTSVEVVSTAAGVDTPVPTGTFVENDNYQIASEIVTITSVTNGSDSTTIVVTRGQVGTAATSHQEDTPMYSTDIEVTNALTLSKTAGTYQSTPGLFNIQLNDVIIGAQSGVVARITSTSAYQDPITQEFIEQVNISSGSSFFGLLFNRLTSISYPNKIIDDISRSQVSIVDFTDNVTAFNADFPNNESISNNIVIYDNETGEFTDDEFIRNYRLRYGGETGNFDANENMAVRKLTFTDLVGGGFFSSGQIIRTEDTKAEIIGYSQARNTIYLGKIGRTQSTGQDYHTASFVAGAQLNTSNSKFGSACLALSAGTSAHTFVSGVTDAIIAGGGATGAFTAATGTTYNPFTGDMVITIGTHTLTTSNTVTITDGGIVFTCAQDGNTNNKAYPRATDPASGSALSITAETDTTITVNVGPVPIDEYLTIPTSTEFGFASGVFTVETWVKLNSVAAGSKTIFDMRSSATELAPYLYVDGANIKYYNNGSVTITGATDLVVDTWYHIALTRTGTDTKLFLNGTQEGSTYSDASNYGSTKPIRIGGDYAGSAITPGYFDDFRVSNSGRYTAAFTAPTGMFHGDVNTKLLFHFDGIDGQKYTNDWSGGEGFTDTEEFNNSAITVNNRQYGGIHKFVSATANAVNSGGNYAHTFVSAVTNGIVSNAGNLPNPVTGATYTASTGNLVITSNAHSLTTSNTVTIADNSLTFKCDMDGNTTHHTYPRSGDPASGQTIAITAVSTNTFTVNIGTSPLVGYDVTAATYDANTGVLVLTIGSHSLPVGESIRIAANALTFSCDKDNFASNHTYPRSTDPAHNNALRVNAVTATTIAVNVGTVKGAKYVITGGVHTFVSGVTGGITPNTGSAVTAASGTTYNAATGDLVLEIGAHSLTTSNTVQIAAGAVTFTCDKDGHQTNHAYPRVSDPVAGTNIAITAETATTITVNVGAVKGQLPAFVGGGTHAFVSGVTNALTASNGASGNFTAASGTTYDHLTGDLVIEIGSHSLTTSNKISIADSGISFTCDADNHTSYHAYPRSTDPVSGQALAITAETATTITVNVGVAAKTTAYKTHRYYDAANSVLKNIDLLSEEASDVATAASPYQLDYIAAASVYSSSDSTAYDYFGSSVAVSDDGTTNKMVVGAYQDDDDAENSGSAYIFDLNGGSQVKITAGSSNAGQGDTFGYSVAVNNNKVAVGAPSDSDDGTNSGSVYIFNADGTNRVKVTASDAAANDYFGHSVAIDGNYLIVGAYGDASSKGAVYRFDLDGTNELKIVASDGVAGDQFGHSIAIGNSKIVVGAPYDDDTASATGSVYVFDLDGTNQVKINHTTPAENDRFGWHVAVGENKIAVGAKYRNNAYVYDLDGTNQVTLSSSGTDGTGGNFGASVAVNQGKVFVGAPIRSITNGSGIVQPSAGKIYAYNLDGTNQVVLNSTEQGSQYDYLGDDFALAVGDNRVIAGSKFADPNNAESAGEIFVWNYTQSLSTTNFALTYKSVLTELIEDMRNGSNSHIWDISAGLVDRTATPVSGIVGYSTVDDNQLLTGLQNIKGHIPSIVNYIPITITGSHGLTQFTDATVTDQSYSTLTTLTPTTVAYTPTDGNMVLTFGSAHGLTTNNLVKISAGSLKFTCTLDGNDCSHAYPRTTDPVYQSTIKITAVTTDTFTVNVGASPVGQQYTHTFVSADANSVTVLNYTNLGCADVVSTVNNLLDIVEDTISEAIGTTTNDQNADHLAVVTKITPITEFIGGRVDAYYEVPFASTYHDATNDYVYTHIIGGADRYRFRDAANLIRANASVIVDKASADMLSRYPDLASTMPRNVGGSTAGTERCKTDLAIIVGEVANDIEYGGNENSITAAKFYLNTLNEIQHIRLQVWQSAYAHERLGYYMKQAINGDLDYTNTDNIITGDWGITNDSGQCANVQTAIDNLIDAINDLIAPTALDYNTAADRLYFNRGYIAEEIVGTSATNLGLLGTELRYSLTSGTFTAATYIRTVYSGYIKDLIVAMISDLQTGGNNSTIAQMQKFLTTDLKIITIDNELYTFFFANEQIRTLAEKAIKNILYTKGTGVTSPQYAASFANATAYRDSITPTDIAAVSCRMRELLDTALNTLFPGKIEARSAVKNILFNENYYKQEIAASVNNQFGQDSWKYDSFVEDIINIVEYDFITSNTTDTQVAYTLTFSSFYGTFITGETITNGSATATVLYSSGSTMIIGSLVGTIFADGDSITAPSGASATIGENGVTVPHEWYNDTSNVKTIETASAISSLIEGSITPTNLWTTPEQFDSNWTTALTEVSANTGTSPDNTITSEKIAITETTGQHHIQRSYTLTSFDTFDSNASKFDSGSLKFDSGAVNPTQTFTSSMFVKASEYNNVRFTVFLDSGTENAHFNANLTTGQIGSIFTTSGLTVTGHGAIPFGNGWYRLYITTEFGFGFATLVNKLNILSNTTALLDFTGTANDIKLSPPLSNNSQLGRTAESISSGNGKVVIGAGLASTDGFDSNGTVYVYDQDGSNQVQILPSVKSSYSYFGYSTSIGNSKIAVGAYGESIIDEDDVLTNAGVVYIFDLDGGNEVKIDMSSSNLTQRSEDYFGQSVAIFNNKVYIGVNGWNGAANNQAQQGAVCVYDLSGNFEYSIQASDAAASDRFGFSVAAGNGKVVIGALGETSSTGAVYVYDAADGANEVKFAHAGPSTGDQFGYGVCVGDNKIGVFSPNMTVGGNAARGGAWVFDLDGTNEVELTPVAGGDGGGAAGIKFGSSMTIDNGKVAVGAPNDQLSSGGVATQGLVFLYDLDGTNGLIESAFDANVADLFGSAVTLISGNLYIAASGGDDQNSNAGSVYLLDITGGPGVFAWGAKLSNEVLGTYVAVSGQEFYANIEYNIKKYSLDLLQDFIRRALDNDLVSPSPTSGFSKFYDSTAGANYDGKSVMGFIRNNIDIIEEQLKSSNHYTTVNLTNSITIQTKSYGTRDIPIGISGELIGSDYFYSLDKDIYAEIQTIAVNESKVAKAYKRFRIDGNITDGPFTMNEVVQKQGDSSITGIVYGFYQDANFKYLDVAVTAGTWSVTDIIEGATNTTTAQVSALENRLHVINVKGSFEENISFRGYTSTESAQPVSYTVNQAAVTNNTGGILTVDTETLLGSLETTSVVYPESSREYLEVKKYAGLDISVGDRIASIGYLRLTVSVDATLNIFQVGNTLYRMVSGGVQDTSIYGTITEVDLDNNYIYVAPIQGSFNITDTIGDFGLGETVLQGTATVSNRTTVAGAASGLVQDVRDVGLTKRLYLTNVIGTFTGRDGLRGPQGYRSSVVTRKILKARVKRFFRGFDGVQTTFNLTTEKGTQYLPDPAGHMMIFVNGILQPPGAGSAYTAFSDKIQFSEPPDIGSSFTGFYIGKLRQLDDISFEFDSLRQSFNLRRDEIFYSLTLTDGVQSSTIRPENNIIVSINGVLQEPGVGFEIVGSRIIFSEIPRFGSTFVAFSYVGSEADVDADVVVPPVEAGDFIDIQGEVSDREVAVIESSNSLITFDYLGSVFGQNAQATANLTSGFIEKVQITAGGSGYTSRPVVRLDSISGFDGQVKALIGVASVTVTDSGTGYQNPNVSVETSVPDDWTAPDLSLYGAEVIDPEVIS